MSRFSLRSATSSLRNHIFFVLAFFSLPMSVMFALFAYNDNELTFMRAIWIVTVWTGLGIVGAFVGWHVIVIPIRRRSRHKEK
jgi:hypothetical protein